MKKIAGDLITDSRSTFKGTVILLFLLGWAFVSVANPLAAARVQFQMVLASVGLQILALLALALEQRAPVWSRSLAVGLLAAAVIYGSLGWGAPELLALLILPVGLAALLISLPAALAVACLLTLLLGAGARLPWWGLSEVTFPAISIWGEYLLLLVLLKPVMDFSAWTMDYYRQVRAIIDESRERKMEYEQTLEDLVRANEQLTRLNNLTQGLRQIAEDARTAKEQFVANVSHELRTPLNMILGFSENILQAPESYGDRLPPALLSDLAVIHRNAQHLSHLIDDVLDLSQIEADQMALSKEWVDVKEVVQDAVIAVQPLYQSKGLFLHAETQPGLPSIFCDRTRIREVLLNLLSNAGRFTEQGGVRVQVREDAGLGILFSVADTGPGISEENMQKLFQPFQQVDGSIRRRFGGTGLGLSISKRFVELHDGKIWIESKIGEGSTFFFRIPFEPSGPPAARGGSSRWLSADWEYRQRTRPSRAPHPAMTPRVIVLDSSGTLIRFLTRYMANASILTANSLEEAGRLYRESPAHALILNGDSMSIEMEKVLHSAEMPQDIPIFVCSLTSAQEEWRTKGVAELLTKPIARETLLGALGRLGIETGTVLIVDDEPDVLQLFDRILTSAGRGYSVLLARDGQEALEVIGEHRPDVILLDLMMPTMNGFQFLETRASTPHLRDIPIILISARDLSGQPLISSAIAITKRSGLSMQEVLAVLETVSRMLSIGWPKGNQALREESAG
jgi:signal transduction histidine kinase/CheY-like chemotaxis protein